MKKTLFILSFSSFIFLYTNGQTIERQIAPPSGYERVPVAENSFGDWLRHAPLKPGNPAVFLYDGSKKWNQSVHVAVMDFDVGKRDLQQCADAVMRLRAEYLFSCGEYEQIHFNFTSGDRADYVKWRAGYRPLINGNKVSWQKKAAVNHSYESFRKYMNQVFTYAGTYSLSQELQAVQDAGDIQIGDVFIQGGFPGHAVIVVDMVQHSESGKKLFLIAQSYMPAQDIHILKNPNNSNLSPWYEVPNSTLQSPEWSFPEGSLKRF